jgi:hypothetical protein
MLRDLVQPVGKMPLAAPPLYLFPVPWNGSFHAREETWSAVSLLYYADAN